MPARSSGTVRRSPSTARARRNAWASAWCFQHFSLFEALTVTDNIALGLATAQEREGLRERIVAISTEYGLPLDPGPGRARSVGGRAAAHRDRALPAAIAPAADHGRAHVGADAAGGAAPFRHAAPARNRGLLDPVYQPQARGGAGAVLGRDHHAPGPQRRARRAGREVGQATGGDHDQRRAEGARRRGPPQPARPRPAWSSTVLRFARPTSSAWT